MIKTDVFKYIQHPIILASTPIKQQQEVKKTKMTSTANEDGKKRNNLKENLLPNGKVLNSRKIVRMKTIRNTERRSSLKEKRDLKLGQAVKILRIIFPLLSCVIMVKMTDEMMMITFNK